MLRSIMRRLIYRFRLNEVGRQQSRLPELPIGDSYSCTFCCLKRFSNVINTVHQAAARYISITEKLFGLGSKAAYGAGIVKNEKFVSSLVDRLAKTKKGRAASDIVADVATGKIGAQAVQQAANAPTTEQVVAAMTGSPNGAATVS